MKTRIYWFSGSGNSYSLAKSLAGKLEDAEPINIAATMKNKNFDTECEVVGLVTPVYGFGLPRIVADFIKNYFTNPSCYYFAVVNSAGGPGGTLSQIMKITEENSTKISAGYKIVMPSNFTPFGGAEPEVKQRQKFSKAEKQLEEIAVDIKNRNENLKSLSSNFVETAGRKISEVSMKYFIKTSEKYFHTNSKCATCGVCSKICPVHNISIQEGKPKWLGHCQQCFACVCWCPESAIEFSWMTKGKRRYHHPDVEALELMVENHE